MIYVQRIKGIGPRITVISFHGCADTAEAVRFSAECTLKPGPTGEWCACRIVLLGEGVDIITPDAPSPISPASTEGNP